MNLVNKTSEGIGWMRFGVESSHTEFILLRGLGRWSEHWCGFQDLLAQAARVTVIDNRGFGLSQNAKVSLNLTVDKMAEDVLEVIDQAHIKNPVLVGVSLGGMIALTTAAKQPETFSKLVLVNTSIGGSPYARITRKALAALSKRFWSSSEFYPALADVLLGTDCSDERKTEFAEHWTRIDKAHDVRPSYVALQLLAALRFSSESILESISTPTIVVKGACDQFVDPRNSDWISEKITGSKLVVCPNGGHELAFDQRDWLLKEILSAGTH